MRTRKNLFVVAVLFALATTEFTKAEVRAPSPLQPDQPVIVEAEEPAMPVARSHRSSARAPRSEGGSLGSSLLIVGGAINTTGRTKLHDFTGRIQYEDRFRPNLSYLIGASFTERLKLGTYAEVPILLRISYPLGASPHSFRPFLELGPVLATPLTRKGFINRSAQISTNYSTLDVGAEAGAGFGLPMRYGMEFLLMANYHLGISPLLRGEQATPFRYWSGVAGFGFAL